MKNLFSYLLTVVLASLAGSFGVLAQEHSGASCSEPNLAGMSYGERKVLRKGFQQCIDLQILALRSGMDQFSPTKKDEFEPMPKVASVVSQLTTLETQRALNEENGEQDDKFQAFLGVNWGVGVGAAFGRGAERIESAELVNDVVRITKNKTDSPRLVLETHYFFEGWELPSGKKFGWGPFAAINIGASGEDTLTSFGLGIMAGAQRINSTASFNVGLGVILDQNVKTLGEGITAGQPLPTGETDVRFQEGSEKAILLFVSTTFD